VGEGPRAPARGPKGGGCGGGEGMSSDRATIPRPCPSRDCLSGGPLCRFFLQQIATKILVIDPPTVGGNDGQPSTLGKGLRVCYSPNPCQNADSPKTKKSISIQTPPSNKGPPCTIGGTRFWGPRGWTSIRAVVPPPCLLFSLQLPSKGAWISIWTVFWGVRGWTSIRAQKKQRGFLLEGGSI